MESSSLHNKESGLLIIIIVFITSFSYGQQSNSAIRNSPRARKAAPLIIHGMRQDFVRIPAGEFMMGSNARPDEEPIHPVKIDSFDLSISEVTVSQFRTFVQATQYVTDAERIGHSFACCWRPKLDITWRNPGFLQSDNEPVVAASWNDAVAYCQWLSDETGGDYRLPSEAEWEYACLAGERNESEFPADSCAWYSENANGHTHQVCTKRPNQWGLFDMLGNAWEWTQDVYHADYKGAPATGAAWITGGSEAQRGYLKPGEGSVLRGGGWGLSEKMHPVSYDIRITSRPVFGRDASCNNSGFRIARNIKSVEKESDNVADRVRVLTVQGIDYEIVWLPKGDYLMGSDKGESENRPSHIIRFKHSFGIGKKEITVKQFRSFVDQTGYVTEAEKTGKCWDSDFRSKHVTEKKSGLNWKNPGFDQTENDPVTCITWDDAMAFCKWLSDKTNQNIRLPSEAEWEYAMCSKSELNNAPSLNESAWYYDNSGFTTHPVGQKIPNEYGIYDMLGNVSEWVMDIWYHDYSRAPADGSSLLGLPVTARVIRGGSFERETNEMGPRMRDWYDESEAVVGTGFRILVSGILHKK